MENPSMQTPATVNQISQEKPNIERSFATLQGDISGSFNAAHNHTIAWFRVMQGQRIQEYKQHLSIKLLTPICPAYQELRCTVKSYFVPDKRVYKNSEEFIAQAGGTTKEKILKKPTLGGKRIPFIPSYQMGTVQSICLTETTAWRDSFISSYIPRVGYLEYYDDTEQPWIVDGAILPDYDACLIRGRIAIYNDYERNKEYEEEITEYNSDEVSQTEWNSYLPTNAESFKRNSMRARRNNSYYSDYRLEMQGLEEELLSVLEDTSSQETLLTWNDIMQSVAEARAQAENAEKNPWDILHELYGTKRKLSEGKTQLLGQYTFRLNYNSVTQSTYNANNDIEKQFQVMGQQGAYSYTEVEIPCFAGFEAIEGGWVHVIATVTADSVFERAFDRTAMAVNWDDEYRPDLKNQKLDVLKYVEMETAIGAQGIIDAERIVGYKRKWSQYFKLPSIVQGDTTTSGYIETQITETGIKHTETEIISQGTHQFYEENAIGFKNMTNNTSSYIFKEIQKDYTDLLLNKNQAIMNEVEELPNTGIGYYPRVKGQNQIFFLGKHYCTTDLPIDEAIKSNFTQWGEK